MHLTSLISIAALALAHGAHSEPNNKHVYSKETFSTSSVCRSTRWKINTKAKEPLASDCQSLEKKLRKHKTDGFRLWGWNLGDKEDDYLIIATEGTCNFGVSVINVNTEPAVIANGDIADLIRDSVKYYSDGDHITGVTGVVPCKANWDSYSKQDIGWSVFA
ncbi:hypothetical protein F4801DRAFT_565661 [Xylaria longipes]|nr:hypothetical protein F4801DRAFT_565661 [Xylaria longipes]RYC54009.1 hypothetical protein CHU98_g12199 [Xylaria longipes]